MFPPLRVEWHRLVCLLAVPGVRESQQTPQDILPRAVVHRDIIVTSTESNSGEQLLSWVILSQSHFVTRHLSAYPSLPFSSSLHTCFIFLFCPPPSLLLLYSLLTSLLLSVLSFLLLSFFSSVTLPQPHTPWLSIFTSWPVWAIVIAHTFNNWGFYTLLTSLPTYLKDTQGINIRSVST